MASGAGFALRIKPSNRQWPAIAASRAAKAPTTQIQKTMSRNSDALMCAVSAMVVGCQAAGIMRDVLLPKFATATEAFASAFYAVAILRRNAYDQKTFMLAGEAVIDAEILTTIMKDADGRMAPISYPADGNFTDSWFKVHRGGWLGGLGSMPSGHEIAIMAVATTFAMRYPHPAWHRWLAYGLAAAAGLSRVTLQSHFTSDTFAGGALGYVIARYVVLGRDATH